MQSANWTKWFNNIGWKTFPSYIGIYGTGMYPCSLPSYYKLAIKSKCLLSVLFLNKELVQKGGLGKTTNVVCSHHFDLIILILCVWDLCMEQGLFAPIMETWRSNRIWFFLFCVILFFLWICNKWINKINLKMILKSHTWRTVKIDEFLYFKFRKIKYFNKENACGTFLFQSLMQTLFLYIWSGLYRYVYYTVLHEFKFWLKKFN